MKDLWNKKWRLATAEILDSIVTPPSSHIVEFGGFKFILAPDWLTIYDKLAAKSRLPYRGYERQGANYKLPYHG